MGHLLLYVTHCSGRVRHLSALIDLHAKGCYDFNSRRFQTPHNPGLAPYLRGDRLQYFYVHAMIFRISSSPGKYSPRGTHRLPLGLGGHIISCCRLSLRALSFVRRIISLMHAVRITACIPKHISDIHPKGTADNTGTGLPVLQNLRATLERDRTLRAPRRKPPPLLPQQRS